ncbi:MAG: flagellar export protein FliJ [Fibromonadales bacterium]|nr:flagellar export protein FliJ [Fibromonadales bacterium]
MKFRFTLASVLNHRERLERDAEIALGKEVQKQVRLENERNELLEEYAKLVPNRGGVNMKVAERFMDFVSYAQRLKDKVAMKNIDIKKQSEEVEKARAILIKKTQDKKALEVLRDSQKAAFKQTEKRAEAKLMDEVAGRLNSSSASSP